MPTKPKKITITEENCLGNWASVNTFLKDADMETAQRLLKREMTGKKRTQIMRRIHQRLNITRGQAERAKLKQP